MFGIRYHVATLSAMFLMLGCGILIGLTSSVNPLISKKQAETIQALSFKLDGVLQESDRDHFLLRQNEAAITQLLPRLVGGKLAGKRVAIIQTGDYEDAAAAAAAAVTAAGGIVASTTTLTGRLQLIDDTQRAGILHDLNLTADPSSDAAVLQILHPITAALRVGTASRSDLATALITLQQDGVVDTTGDLSDPVADVVVVGGSSSDGDNSIEADLVASLTDATKAPLLTVVGCEPFDVETSSMGTFSNAGISTVDCIDQPIGALDLPYALRDGSQVAYGVKTTATRLVPAALTTDADQPVAAPAKAPQK